jgi:polyphenol oxidase
METGLTPVEVPLPLGKIADIAAGFIPRIPGVDVSCERTDAMARLKPIHLAILQEQGLGNFPLVTAEQVHGREISVVQGPSEYPIFGVDGLVTAQHGITLGIYVADCAPVWIIARDGSAGALLHSGKKGTELGITAEGVSALIANTGKRASDFLAVIGPCIRPPCYEVDFAKEIARQAREAGVDEIHDEGICTACHVDRYYSYRREKGLTGRMLATLTLLRKL